MLSNAYFLAKFRFDTAENEPAKNLQKIATFANFDAEQTTRTAFARAWGAGGFPAARQAGSRRTCGAICVNLRGARELVCSLWEVKFVSFFHVLSC